MLIGTVREIKKPHWIVMLYKYIELHPVHECSFLLPPFLLPTNFPVNQDQFSLNMRKSYWPQCFYFHFKHYAFNLITLKIRTIND